jgi:hypothetical protein
MPRGVVEPSQLAKTDGIPYRKLTRGDFRAKKAPIANASHAAQMSAFSCASVVPKGELQMELRQRSAAGAFVARTAQARFVAKMDRNCSWWNPAPSDEAPSFILQHEQIHFAIAELAARDLTQRVRQLSATGDSAEQAAAALQRDVDGVFREQGMTERNADFDRDTSGRHDPELQRLVRSGDGRLLASRDAMFSRRVRLSRQEERHGTASGGTAARLVPAHRTGGCGRLDRATRGPGLGKGARRRRAGPRLLAASGAGDTRVTRYAYFLRPAAAGGEVNCASRHCE